MSETIEQAPKSPERNPSRVNLHENVKNMAIRYTGTEVAASTALRYDVDQESQAKSINTIMTGISTHQAQSNAAFRDICVCTFPITHENSGKTDWVTAVAGVGQSESDVESTTGELLSHTNLVLESLGSPLRV